MVRVVLAYNYGYPMEWQLPYPNLANDFLLQGW